MKTFILYSFLMLSLISCSNKINITMKNVVKKLSYDTTALTVLNGTIILQVNNPMVALSNPVAENNAKINTFTAEDLPPGLILNKSSGSISGTPTLIGVYNVSITGYAANNSRIKYIYEVKVFVNNAAAPSSLIYPSPNNHTANVFNSIAVTSVNGSNLVYSSSGLPTGYSVDSSTGLISGTYTGIGGDFDSIITATNGDGSTNAIVSIIIPCDAAYTKISGICIQTIQSRACLSQPSNSTGGTEATTNAGLNWNACSGYSCNAGYTNIAGICTQTNQTRVCQSQPSNSTGGTEATTDAGQTWGSCSGFTCAASYTEKNGTCTGFNLSMIMNSAVEGVSGYNSFFTDVNNTVSGSCIDGISVNLTISYNSFADTLFTESTMCSGGSYSFTLVRAAVAHLPFETYSNYNVSVNQGTNNINTISESLIKEVSSKSCAITNGTGSQSYINNGSYSVCSVVSCNVGYTSVGGACVLNNTAPIGSSYSYFTDKNTAYNGTVTATDAENDTLTYTVVSQGAHGAVAINATTGAFTYTPNNNYIGADSFTFKANDGTVDSSATQISFYVGCPTGYVSVPANGSLGVDAFCIMKNEAIEKAYGNGLVTALSSESSFPTPWVNVTIQQAKDACKALGSKYDIPSNAEWMTIARNVEAVATNWSSGVVGTGSMAKGHTDGNPGNIIERAESTVDPYTDTLNSAGSGWDQKRTLTLSSGSIIWDFSGNAREWVDWLPDGSATPTKSPINASCDNSGIRNIDTISGCATPFPVNSYLPANPAGKSTYGYLYGLGQIWGNQDSQYGYAVRGGTNSEGDFAGIYSLSVWWGYTETDHSTGFRCVFRPL